MDLDPLLRACIVQSWRSTNFRDDDSDSVALARLPRAPVGVE
jgi:hypothetical protein